MKVENTRRFAKGKLSVVKKQCPDCGHTKAFNKNERIECSKCRFEHE